MDRTALLDPTGPATRSHRKSRATTTPTLSTRPTPTTTSQRIETSQTDNSGDLAAALRHGWTVLPHDGPRDGSRTPASMHEMMTGWPTWTGAPATSPSSCSAIASTTPCA
eukprot:2452613-Pyramimonas_sp.AAC.1